MLYKKNKSSAQWAIEKKNCTRGELWLTWKSPFSLVVAAAAAAQRDSATATRISYTIMILFPPLRPSGDPPLYI